MLTIQQTEYISTVVEREHIHFSHLAAELIDHICCDVEKEMQQGVSFMDAMNRVETRIGYRGLKKVQEDTLYLLDKNYRIMKNLMKATGIIGPALMGIGSLFKIMHWPSAGILLVLGFAVLCLLFLPAAVSVLYKESGKGYSKALYIFGFVAAFLYSIGILWKVQHWPGAAWLLLLGNAVAIFVFLPLLLNHKLKDTDEKKNTVPYVLGFISLVMYMLGNLFKIMHWPGAAILLVGGAILLFGLAIPLYSHYSYRDAAFVKGSFLVIILVSVWMIISASLISIKVSTNLFDKYALVYEDLMAANKSLSEQNALLFAGLSAAGQDSSVVALREQATSLVTTISGIRSDLALAADFSEGGDLGADPFASIKNIDSKEVPFVLMIGEGGKGYAPGLQKDLLAFIQNVNELAVDTEHLISADLAADLQEEEWVQSRFNRSLGFVLDYLALLEQKVLLIESEMYLVEN